MKPIQFEQICPIFRIFDIDKAKEFYLDYLGFQKDWEHQFDENMPLYMQVSRGNLILHLSEHHGDASPGANLFVRLQGVDALHQEITAPKHGVEYRFLRLERFSFSLNRKKRSIYLFFRSFGRKTGSHFF